MRTCDLEVESDSKTLLGRGFVREKRSFGLGAKWRRSRHKHYLLALNLMDFKKSNSLCQKEL